MSGPVKGKADYLALGDWNIACSMCGRKLKASQAVKNWQGYWRCREHNEPRHPQDFVRGIQDVQTPAFVQPQTDIDIQICTLNGISAVPGYAIPGCMIPGNTVYNPILDVCTIQGSSSIPALAEPGCSIPGRLPF